MGYYFSLIIPTTIVWGKQVRLNSVVEEETKEYLQLEVKYGVGKCGGEDCKKRRLMCFIDSMGRHIALTRQSIRVWSKSIVAKNASIERPPSLPVFDYVETRAPASQFNHQNHQNYQNYQPQPQHQPMIQPPPITLSSQSAEVVIIASDGREVKLGLTSYTRVETFASLFKKTDADLADKILQVWVAKGTGEEVSKITLFLILSGMESGGLYSLKGWKV
jgi:hypothetical protein